MFTNSVAGLKNKRIASFGILSIAKANPMLHAQLEAMLMLTSLPLNTSNFISRFQFSILPQCSTKLSRSMLKLKAKKGPDVEKPESSKAWFKHAKQPSERQVKEPGSSINLRMIDRQRDEVIRDILKTASQHSEGVGITKIMFHAYLTHSRAKAYLDDLVQKGLLSNDTSGLGRNFYHTTPKGFECLAALSDLTEMLRIESMRHAKSTF